jgi:hypothetical protein
MFWKFVIFCIKLASEWPILLPGNGQNAGFYTIYPRASGDFLSVQINLGSPHNLLGAHQVRLPPRLRGAL